LMKAFFVLSLPNNKSKIKKMAIFGLFSKEKKEILDKGLAKTKESVLKKLSRAVAGKSKVDDEVLDQLEEILIGSDVGVDTTIKIIARIEQRVKKDKYFGTEELNVILKEEIATLLNENSDSTAQIDDSSFNGKDGNPYVIMVVGVNGVGKTTTIGKLAHMFKKAGKLVYLGAADTFRAAAVEQLSIWADRVGVAIVKQIGRFKKENNVTALQINRWSKLMDDRVNLGKKLDLNDTFVKILFQLIHEDSVRMQTEIMDNE